MSVLKFELFLGLVVEEERTCTPLAVDGVRATDVRRDRSFHTANTKLPTKTQEWMA